MRKRDNNQLGSDEGVGETGSMDMDMNMVRGGGRVHFVQICSFLILYLVPGLFCVFKERAGRLSWAALDHRHGR